MPNTFRLNSLRPALPLALVGAAFCQPAVAGGGPLFSCYPCRGTLKEGFPAPKIALDNCYQFVIILLVERYVWSAGALLPLFVLAAHLPLSFVFLFAISALFLLASRKTCPVDSINYELLFL